MRQPSIIILLISIFMQLALQPSFSAIRGGIDYSIPIDYSKLSESELKVEAEKYFYLAQRYKDSVMSEEATKALFLYSLLQNISPKNPHYPVKQGIIYDKLHKDRYAKGCFSRSIGVDEANPESYFYFAEFYYKRELYRKALRYYNEAYKRGYHTNYEVLYKIGDIYEKFGDTKSALKYLYEAQKQSSNPNLENKINKINNQNSVNKEYYTNTRIRIN